MLMFTLHAVQVYRSRQLRKFSKCLETDTILIGSVGKIDKTCMWVLYQKFKYIVSINFLLNLKF